MRAAAVAVLAVLLAASAADQKSWDCKMRQLGLDFAQALQPFRSLVPSSSLGRVCVPFTLLLVGNRPSSKRWLTP